MPAVTNPEPTVDDSPHTPQTEVLPQQAGANQQVMTEQWSFDEEEESKVTAFMSSGCGCTLVNKGPCSALFSREHYAMMRADAAALTWSELNMVVMGGSNGTYSDGDHEPHHSLPTPWAPCLQENIPVFAWSQEAEVGADQTSLLKPWSRLTCTWQHRSHSSTCPGDGRCAKHNHFCHAVFRSKCHSITRAHSRLQAE